MKISLFLSLLLPIMAASAQPPASLVPTTPSTASDYYCTWNLQGYVCSYGAGAGSNDLRLEINEDNLFGCQLGYKVWGHEQAKTTQTSGQPPCEVTWIVPSRYQGWLSHYPMLHADLTFVLDDSWDIPHGPGPDGASKRPHGRNYDNEHLATMAIAPDRFPSFQGDDLQRMTQLVKAVKEQGWRSLGGWVCAQNPIGLTHEYTGLENTYENSLRWTTEQEERFWKRRLARWLQLLESRLGQQGPRRAVSPPPEPVGPRGGSGSRHRARLLPGRRHAPSRLYMLQPDYPLLRCQQPDSAGTDPAKVI